jgi:hypothetical protein
MNLGRRIRLFGAWTSGEWNFHWGCALISKIKKMMMGIVCWAAAAGYNLVCLIGLIIWLT